MMLSRSAALVPICPLCESRAFCRAGQMPKKWMQQSRAASQLQKRRPSRMVLSPSVAKAPPRSSTINGNTPGRRPSPGMFGGLNRTRPGLAVEAERARREARSQAVKEHKTERQEQKFNPRRREPRSRKNERQPGEMKALKMHQALHNIPYERRTEVKHLISDIESFDQFPLLQSVQSGIIDGALQGLTDITPTPIQRLAIPSLMGLDENLKQQPASKREKQQQFLLAAETGSGKTMAYAIPTIDAVKRAELLEAEETARLAVQKETARKKNLFELDPPPLSSEEIDSTTARPRAIVLVPSAELVDQVGAVFKAFSHSVKFRAVHISATYSAAVIRSRLFKQPADILISTPHLLQSIATATPNILSRVTHLVIDEADSLFDRSFAPTTSALLDRINPSLTHLILASATIPRSLDTFLRGRFPQMTRLTTPNLHAIPRRVQLSTLDIDEPPYNGNRDLACADSLWTIGRSELEKRPTDSDATTRILVFVNERSEAVRLASYLVAKGIDAAPLTRDASATRDADPLALFTSTSAPLSPVAATKLATSAKRVLPATKVLVTTDLGSRGIDTVAVRHVLLYDVPHSSVDFIHRLGRTGRMGRRGRAIVLVGKGDRRDVIRDVREAMYRGQALI